MFKQMFRGCALALLGLCSPSVLAQSCSPQWSTQIGNPGSAGGYVGAFASFDDGSGPHLYAGGSFTSIGGSSSGKYLARWNAPGGTWSALGSGINPGFTNAFITSLVPYNDGKTTELVAGGFFASAGGAPGTKSLAKWNGSVWSNLGSQFVANSADSVWAMLTWDDGGGEKLYVAGGFPAIAGQAAGSIAAWDGETWTPLATSLGGAFSPVIFALAVFDPEDGSGLALYAAGRFNTIDGVTANLIARYGDAGWSQVGSGLSGDIFSDVSALAVFDDGDGPALYTGGSSFRPVGGPPASVARWDGSNWTTVGQNLGGRTTALAVFDDGDGAALYGGGTAQPGIAYLYRLEDDAWVTLDGGVSGSVSGSFPSVFALRAWEDHLYVGGDFTTVGGQTANGLVARTSCAASATIVSANPPTDNPFVAGTQPYRDVLQTGTTSAATQGIGGDGTPAEDSVAYAPLSVTFSSAPSPAPTPGNISVSCTGGACPSVAAVSGGPTVYEISLSGPVPPGECTTLTFAGAAVGQKLQYEYLPGDVNLNGAVSPTDVQALLLAINNGQAALASNLPRYNVNRAGTVTNSDVLRLVGLLNGLGTTQVWTGATSPACP